MALRDVAYIKKLLTLTDALCRKFAISDDNLSFLRATAVPPGTAEARISYGNSVCLSVRHDPVRIQCQVR